jgi:hypothetical protein
MPYAEQQEWSNQRMGWLLNVEQVVEWELARETDLLGENQPQCHMLHQ